MARMSDLESVFCRTATWRWLARRLVVPRVLERTIGPQVLEIGCGSGAMAAEVLRLRGDEITHFTATDVDPAMVALAKEQLKLVEVARAHSPMFTLRGGTNEVLRGMVAKGMGLR